MHEHIELGLSNKYDPSNQFAFYSQALNALFDASQKKSDFETRAKLAESVFRLENVLAISDDSMFARGEGEIQRKAVSDAQRLIVNYTKMLGGAKSSIADSAALERSLAAETEQLNKTVERGRKISQIVEFGASFVHPAVLLSVTIKNLTREYRMSSDMQWSTGLMLVASALALRHAGALKGAFEGIEATVAGKALRTAEIGIGLTLTGAGAKSIYDQLASGKSLKDISFEAAMLFVPLAYATVRPVVASKARAFAGKRFDSLVERDWSEQAATSSDMERLRLEFSRDPGGKVSLVESRSEVVTTPELPVQGPKNKFIKDAFTKTDESPPRGFEQAKRSEAPTTISESSWPSKAVDETVLDESRNPQKAPTPIRPEQSEGALLLSGMGRDELAFFTDFSRLDAAKQEATISAIRTVSPDTATRLSEFAALKNLAKEFGLPQEQLESVYSHASDLTESRARLLIYIESTGRLDFGLDVKKIPSGALDNATNFVEDNPQMTSLLLSEGMLGNLRSSYPEQVPEGSMIVGMKYRRGMRGTFEVEVRTPDDTKLSFFAKFGDSHSARLGSRSSLEAGHPAPQVSAMRAFKDHSTGKPDLFWFMPSIHDFRGTIKIAGRSIDVQETVEARSMSKVASSKKSGLNDLLVNHPDIYNRELGRAQAGWLQSGIYDGHESNVYAMFVRVSKEDGAFLKKNGYHVQSDGNSAKLFIFGRIDTDWAGSYGGAVTSDGYDFTHMFLRLSRHDLSRIYARNVTRNPDFEGTGPILQEKRRACNSILRCRISWTALTPGIARTDRIRLMWTA